MKNLKHTPEPWIVADNYKPTDDKFNHSILSVANGAKSVAEIWRHNFPEVGKNKFDDAGVLNPSESAQANAERIVACVNALEGIDNPKEFLEELKDLLIRASGLIGNPGANISGSTDLACYDWQLKYQSFRDNYK